MRNPYHGSDAAELLLPRTADTGLVWVLVLDLDGTLASGHNPTQNEIVARHRLFELAAEKKATVVFSTARSPELLMSRAAYRASARTGFARPRPKAGYDEQGLRIDTPLEAMRSYEGLLDPPVMNCVGYEGPLVKHGSGYRIDTDHVRLLGEPATWHDDAIEFIRMADPSALCRLALINRPGSYEANLVDVARPPFRIELRYEGADAAALRVDAKVRLVELQRRVKEGEQVVAQSGRVIPTATILDYRILDEHTAADTYRVFLVPSQGSKEFGVRRIISGLAQATGIDEARFRLCVFGDTETDGASGFDALRAGGIFGVAGGSSQAARLGPPRHLMTEIAPGAYQYESGIFIVADEAVPKFKGAESVLLMAQHYWH